MSNLEIHLNDLLQLQGDELANAKIRFVQQANDASNSDPLERYKANPEEVNTNWLFWCVKQRYFREGALAIGLLKLHYGQYLLATVKKVTAEHWDVHKGIRYEGIEIERLKPFFGRVVIRFGKNFRTQQPWYSKIMDQLIVTEVLSDQYHDDEFPGYDKVRLMYPQLKRIVDNRPASWVGALENQKAVYLITDTATGTLYVGSATSDKGMLLQRWGDYAANGHGGDVLLKQVVAEKGFDYVKKNFQYSILENYNARTDDQVILDRETWWKVTLSTRDGKGFNAN